MLRRFLAARAVLPQGPLNRSEERFFIHRLGEKVGGSSLHRSHSGWDVASPGKKNHRNRCLCRNQPLDFQAAQSWHFEIQNQAGARVSAAKIKEVLSRGEEPHTFAISP